MHFFGFCMLRRGRSVYGTSASFDSAWLFLGKNLRESPSDPVSIGITAVDGRVRRKTCDTGNEPDHEVPRYS
jgi:hypothetical protein